ncbi:DUF2182 domain-containing protein [Bradyrhizobium sp. WSM 1738]|nr:DUF2182 domain-containing protein [Bradyrhizobium hereditatis]
MARKNALGLVLLMWAAMTAAMMLPSLLPVILVLIRIGGAPRAAGFIAGYLVAWAGFSVAATLAHWALLEASPRLNDDGERKRALECRCAGGRWPLPVHAIEARLSCPLSFAMGYSAQSLERDNGDARGLAPWRFLRRLLLGVYGAAVRRGCYEPLFESRSLPPMSSQRNGRGRGMVQSRRRCTAVLSGSRGVRRRRAKAVLGLAISMRRLRRPIDYSVLQEGCRRDRCAGNKFHYLRGDLLAISY